MLTSGACLVLSGAIFWAWFCEEAVTDYRHDFEGSVWFAWTMFFDPGTHTSLDREEYTSVKVLATLLAAVGMIYNLSFLGMIVELVHSSLSQWAEHRHRIVLTGHTLVLGWTSKTLFLLNELINDCMAEGVAKDIVVMAERDEMDMLKKVRAHFSHVLSDRRVRMYVRRIRVRCGCPHDADALDRTSAGSAAEIVVLGGNFAHSSDLQVVRTTMALAAMPLEPSGRIVAEVQRAESAYVLSGLLPGTEGICARVAVNCVLCLLATRLEVGLSFVTLCTAAEESIYAVSVPGLAGLRFGEASRRFRYAICIGVKRVDGQVAFAPQDRLLIGADDKLLLLGRNKTAVGEVRPILSLHERLSLALRPSVLADEVANAALEHSERMKVVSLRALNCAASAATGVFQHMIAPVADKNADQAEGFDVHRSQCTLELEPMPTMGERMSHNVLIVVGWCNAFPDIAHVLDQVVPPGTRLHVLSERSMTRREAGLQGRQFKRLWLVHHVGERMSLHQLSLLPLHKSSMVLVLSEDASSADLAEGHQSNIDCDAACFACVQMVSMILEDRNAAGLAGDVSMEAPPRPTVICEIVDSRSDCILARSALLRQQAIYFRSSALETGLFNIAASDACSFNSLMILLAQSAGVSQLDGEDWQGTESLNTGSVGAALQSGARGLRVDTLQSAGDAAAAVQFGSSHCKVVPCEIAAVPVEAYARRQSRSTDQKKPAWQSKPVAPEGASHLWCSFWDLHDIVRQTDGAILLGWSEATHASTRCPSVQLVPQVDRDEHRHWLVGTRLIVLRARPSYDNQSHTGHT